MKIWSILFFVLFVHVYACKEDQQEAECRRHLSRALLAETPSKTQLENARFAFEFLKERNLLASGLALDIQTKLGLLESSRQPLDRAMQSGTSSYELKS
jgi:hypothetical protein